MTPSRLPRYAWLNRRARLPRGAVPVRRTPMRRTRMQPKRPGPAVPRDVRAALVERSGGYCEIRLAGCRGRATDAHHRVTGKSGGRCSDEARAEHDRLSDLLHACRWCHDAVHDMGEPAFASGWHVREGFDPARKCVAYRGEPRWLDDAGGVHDYAEGAA